MIKSKLSILLTSLYQTDLILLEIFVTKFVIHNGSTKKNLPFFIPMYEVYILVKLFHYKSLIFTNYFHNNIDMITDKNV